MKKNTHYLIVVLSVLSIILASLACNLPIRKTAVVPVTTQSAGEFSANLQEAAEEAAKTGIVDFTFSESQITSFLALQLQSEPDPFLQNPQIFLRDGKIEIHGDVKQSGLLLPFKASISVEANGSGGMDYHLDSGSISSIPLPKSILEQIDTQARQMIDTIVTEQLSNVYIENVSIADGSMTVTGQSR